MNNKSFSIFAKYDRSYVIDNVSLDTTLNELKYMISKRINISVAQYYITSCCKTLDSMEIIIKNPTIEEFNKDNKYKIEKDRTIYINIHPYKNLHKSLAYFLYENNCKLLKIDHLIGKNYENDTLKITAELLR